MKDSTWRQAAASVAAFLFLSVFACAQEAPKAAAPVAGDVPKIAEKPHIPSLQGVPDCSLLAKEEGWQIRNKLLTFQVVFGKSAILWVEDDYLGLMALARACHGAPAPGGGRFDGNNYATMIDGAFHTVMPIAILAKRTEEYGRKLAPEKLVLPPCYKFLDFKLDTWAQTDNSSEVFGADFMTVSDDDLHKAVDYANQCLLYLPDYAHSARDMRKNAAEDLLGSIMDRALYILKARQDYADWGKHPDTDVVMDDNGVVIPPTMASKLGRQMIMRYDRAAVAQRSFTPEMVATLMRLVDDVQSQNVNRTDKLYSDEIGGRVNAQIFNNRAMGSGVGNATGAINDQ